MLVFQDFSLYCLSAERYYLLRIDHSDVCFSNMTQNEKRQTKDCKWWSSDEIRESSEKFFMDNLAEELTRIINGDITPRPILL